MATKIFCLILNYNQPRDTLHCAKSILASRLPPSTEIILIDNGSRSLKSFFAQHLPKCQYLKSPGNIGFAAGNNQGIQLALTKGATHILIINPDVTVPPHFLYPLLQTLRAHPRAGLVAPAHTEPARNATHSVAGGGQGSYGLGGHINWRYCAFPHDNVTNLPTHPKSYDLLTFACVLIKKEVFLRAGSMDERYFLYLEDVDYCVTAKRAGFNLLLDPQVVVTHRTSSSFADPRAKIKYSFRSSFIFIRKWYRFPGNLLPILHTIYFYPSTYLLWTWKIFRRKM